MLVTFGQSNSANYAEYMVKSEETIGVINWFDGSCYKAQSPLLGASGTKGEWISLLARELIQRGTYDNVIVVSLGIGGSPVAAWEEGSLLNDRLKRVLLKLKGSYKITDMLWQQGETDARWGIGSKSYFDSFVSLESSIRSISIDAPIFNSIGSAHCDNDNYPNRVTNAQLALVRERKGIVLGVNTDELITTDMRYDNCHFGESGQRTAASAAALIISSYHQLNK